LGRAAEPPASVPRRAVSVAALVLVVTVGSSGAAAPPHQDPLDNVGCRNERLSRSYTRQVQRALLAKQDVWGNSLLRLSDGPTYDSVRRYLKPLMLVGHPAGTTGRRLTDSGVYYLAFGQPIGSRGAGSVALHVADGSQIVSEKGDGPNLTVYVGGHGRERYGSCVARLARPRLFAGYLPVLETRYVDSVGVHYEQESFAARIAQTRSLVSFVRLTVGARPSTGTTVQLRLRPSATNLAVSEDRLIRGRDTYLWFSPGARFDGSSLIYSIKRQTPRTIYLARLDHPSPSQALALDQAGYEQVRRSVIDYWERRLAQGTTFVVPERRVLNAERSLLIQNLEMTWRYSVGNDYEEFSFPESIDGAEVMGEYGFQEADRAMLRTALWKKLALYPNLEIGEKLLGFGLYYRLFADRSLIDVATPIVRGYMAYLTRQLAGNGRGILDRERYSSDLPDSVYGLNSQAVVWQGLRLIADAWALTSHGDLARNARGMATRLEFGLRSAVRASARKLPDGSLFIPVRLFDGEAPYDALTASKLGSYWNLVMPYALASGLFSPRSPEALGALRYMLNHGSRLLGLVRAGAFSLYPSRRYPTSGSDEVYGLNVARFLADNDQPDQLSLSFYGQLAAAMTPGTFVSGEGATIAPVGGEYYRRMYLPPNSVSNAAFLEKLRLMLIHETHDRKGHPQGLELAYATPRDWLRPGKRILVRRAPTSFGRLSFSIKSTRALVHVALSVPSRAPLRTLRLRLRLPRGNRMIGVVLGGRPFHRFDAATKTIDLSGRTGSLDLIVHYERH
jgi:hypothetical protein